MKDTNRPWILGIGSSHHSAVCLLSGAAGLLVFALLATLNAAGYRYGVADQAFYVPAILQDVDPALFPRDGALIASQSRLFVLDELLAAAHEATGLSLAALFAAGYVVTIAVLYGGLVSFGSRFAARRWTLAAFVFAATLRHRIAKTGANTLEGHFHPRMLAFGIGVCALAAVLRRRTLAASALVALAGVIHPTTALWFAVWVGVALAVNDARLRGPIVVAAAAAALAGALVLFSGTLTLAPMDDAWMAAFAGKDYIFPTDWSVDTWALNLAYPVVVVAAFAARRRAGLVRDGEAGVVLGCLALVALFLASLPLIAARSAFVVQLQVSRVFWMADLLATIYAVWWVAEGTATRWGTEVARVRWRAPALACVLAIVALARGWYGLAVAHPGRALVELDLPDDAWRDVSRWLRSQTPKHAHLLADPGHAYRYGTSLRVSAERDVFLEEVKDGAIGLYDRGVALRVSERDAALGDFSSLSAGRLRALTARYDLTHVVTEGSLPLLEVYRNTRFRVYRLAP